MQDATVPPTAVTTTPTTGVPRGSTTATQPVLAPGTVLYAADWSTGLNGWTGSSQWKSVPGAMVSDGTAFTDSDSTVTAPFFPTTSNYRIEATAAIVKRGFGCQFGLYGRGGYTVGTTEDGYVDGSRPFLVAKGLLDTLAETFHTYAASFHGNRIELEVDGAVVLQDADNRFLAPGRVGVTSRGCQVELRSFTVTVL